MKFRITSKLLVKQDLQEAIDYYKQITPRLATEFLQRIREAKNRIAENPFADDIMYKDIRMHMVSQFPYHIHSLVDENLKQIIIIAIAFAKRDNLDFS